MSKQTSKNRFVSGREKRLSVEESVWWGKSFLLDSDTGRVFARSMPANKQVSEQDARTFKYLEGCMLGYSLRREVGRDFVFELGLELINLGGSSPLPVLGSQLACRGWDDKRFRQTVTRLKSEGSSGKISVSEVDNVQMVKATSAMYAYVHLKITKQKSKQLNS